MDKANCGFYLMIYGQWVMHSVLKKWLYFGNANEWPPSFSYFSYLLLQLPVVQFIVGLINISIALSYDSESGQTVTTLGSYTSIASALLGGEPPSHVQSTKPVQLMQFMTRINPQALTKPLSQLC